jgi:hypothetical protein
VVDVEVPQTAISGPGVTGSFGLIEESVDLQPDLEGLAGTFMEGLRPWDGSWWLDRMGSCWEPEGLLTMRGWPR